jgi:hypothetical protein
LRRIKDEEYMDKITEELVPDLKYFGWQYDSPIDYDTLKFVLFKAAQKC